jgi:hypothetical protein
VIVPSSAVDTMNLGAMSGLIALGQQGVNPMPGKADSQPPAYPPTAPDNR